MSGAKPVTMPGGLRLHGENATEFTETFFRHCLAALSERMCPYCSGPVADTCLSPAHRPMRFHVCPDRQRVTEFYLDVPRMPVCCERCGAEMAP